MNTRVPASLLLLMAIAVPLPAQVGEIECQRCWSGFCEVESILNPASLERFSWSAACRIEIVPAEGFVNRWRILMIPFDKDPAQIWLPEVADFLTSQAMDDAELTGVIWYTIPLWGRIRFISIDPETRRDLRELSDVPETRPHNIKIGPLQDREGQPVRRVIELLVEEPQGTFVGGVVAWEWLQKHWRSIQLLYGIGMESGSQNRP